MLGGCLSVRACGACQSRAVEASQGPVFIHPLCSPWYRARQRGLKKHHKPKRLWGLRILCHKTHFVSQQNRDWGWKKLPVFVRLCVCVKWIFPLFSNHLSLSGASLRKPSFLSTIADPSALYFLLLLYSSCLWELGTILPIYFKA